jgi:hypothetical protein
MTDDQQGARVTSDGTAPPAAVLAAAVQDALDAIGCELTMSDCEVAAAAVVAALRLPERDRETAAKAWDRGYAAGHSNAMRRMSDEPHAPTSRNPYAEHDPAALGRASALREGRADG